MLVSEVMLQQTQVARVTDFYARFLARFPTLEALAGATQHEVHALWQGLGYYRRATNLHRLAQVVVAEHGGQLPREPERLRLLPGVGRDTAGAVATFAFERATPAVDTNVGRVIRRAFHPRAAGALICTARVARCEACPVRAACATGARRAGSPSRG